ncbi:MAG TPA: acyl-ACP--UDP-N-acetylglucosamine O-acyltransferase [Polyangiaceae bacterium]
MIEARARTCQIHPSAVVEVGAKLGQGVVVGPFCYVGRDVELGDGTTLVAHATVLGPSRIGKNNRVFPYATLGAAPQDRSFSDEPTELWVEDHNVFREQVTVHRGSTKGDGITRIGSGCWFMVGAHVAHDCVIQDGVMLTNLTSLGGHVHAAPGAVCGGHVAVAPFVRLGRNCFVAGGARVERDVPPYVIVSGDRARVRALNRVGLERSAIAAESQAALARAFALIWRSGEPVAKGLSLAREELGSDPCVRELVEFLETSRPLARARR